MKNLRCYLLLVFVVFGIGCGGNFSRESFLRCCGFLIFNRGIGDKKEEEKKEKKEKRRRRKKKERRKRKEKKEEEKEKEEEEEKVEEEEEEKEDKYDKIFLRIYKDANNEGNGYESNKNGKLYTVKNGEREKSNDDLYTFVKNKLLTYFNSNGDGSDENKGEVCIITGPGGLGKTSILKAAVKTVKELYEEKCYGETHIIDSIDVAETFKDNAENISVKCDDVRIFILDEFKSSINSIPSILDGPDIDYSDYIKYIVEGILSLQNSSNGKYIIFIASNETGYTDGKTKLLKSLRKKNINLQLLEVTGESKRPYLSYCTLKDLLDDSLYKYNKKNSNFPLVITEESNLLSNYRNEFYKNIKEIDIYMKDDWFKPFARDFIGEDISEKELKELKKYYNDESYDDEFYGLFSKYMQYLAEKPEEKCLIYYGNIFKAAKSTFPIIAFGNNYMGYFPSFFDTNHKIRGHSVECSYKQIWDDHTLMLPVKIQAKTGMINTKNAFFCKYYQICNSITYNGEGTILVGLKDRYEKFALYCNDKGNISGLIHDRKKHCFTKDYNFFKNSLDEEISKLKKEIDGIKNNIKKFCNPNYDEKSTILDCITFALQAELITFCKIKIGITKYINSLKDIYIDFIECNKEFCRYLKKNEKYSEGLECIKKYHYDNTTMIPINRKACDLAYLLKGKIEKEEKKRCIAKSKKEKIEKQEQDQPQIDKIKKECILLLNSDYFTDTTLGNISTFEYIGEVFNSFKRIIVFLQESDYFELEKLKKFKECLNEEIKKEKRRKRKKKKKNNNKKVVKAKSRSQREKALSKSKQEYMEMMEKCIEEICKMEFSDDDIFQKMRKKVECLIQKINNKSLGVKKLEVSSELNHLGRLLLGISDSDSDSDSDDDDDSDSDDDDDDSDSAAAAAAAATKTKVIEFLQTTLEYEINKLELTQLQTCLCQDHHQN